MYKEQFPLSFTWNHNARVLKIEGPEELRTFAS